MLHSLQRFALQPFYETEATSKDQVMSISSIGSHGSLTSSVHVSATRQKPAERAFEKMDTDSSGSVGKDEFVRSSSTLPQPPAKAAAPSAEELFDKADGNSDGTLSKEEFVASAPKEGVSSGPSSARAGKAGPPPGGGPPPAGGAKGAGPSSSDSASATSDTTDPADANEDGKVTEAEQMAYDLKQALTSYQSSDTSTEAASTAFDVSA